MAKQRKRKKRLRIGRLIFLLLLLAGIFFAFIKLVKIPIMNVTISGNKIVSDEEIIESAKLDKSPNFLDTFSYMVKKDILKNEYLKDAKVSKGLLSLKIKVTEKKPLFIEKKNGKVVSKEGLLKNTYNLSLPILTTDVPKEEHALFVKAMATINDNVLMKMSEIKYDPNDIDKNRYYVYMNDGNGVYLTVHKFKKINEYDTIL